MPGPRSTTRTSSRPPLTPRAHRDGLAGAVAGRVLEQVRERPLELRGVGADQRQVAVDGEPTRSPASPASSTAARRTSSTEHQSRARLGRAGLQPREVEQLVDSRASRALSRDHAGASSRRARRLDSGGEPAPRPAVDDRGQRRAQVVRDRAQQRGLDLVASGAARASRRPRARAARARSAAASSASSAGHALGARQRRRRGGRDEQRAEPLLAAQQRKRGAALVARHRLEHDRGTRRARAPARSAAPPAASASGRSRRAEQERARARRRGRPRGRAARPPRRARARPRRRSTRDDRGDEEDGERDPVLAPRRS